MKKCIVTGGAGFIGSNLVTRLITDGWNVYIVDNLTTGDEKFFDDVSKHDNVQCYKTSYGSNITADIVHSLHPDIVFHLGAIPRVLYSVEQPYKTNMNNVQETLALLDACKGNVGRFVFASSSSVCGDVDVFPTPTTIPKRPKSPYALQKSVVEDYCRLWSELYDLDTIVLRYFNVFGPRQYGDSPYSTVISAWCNNIVEGRPLRLDGSGKQSRDFCYVDNVVDANIAAAESSRRFNGDIANIAGGECHTLLDVLDMFYKRFGRDAIHVVHAPARQGDVYKTLASLAEARELLDYVPRIMFNEGLNRTFDWWGL